MKRVLVARAVDVMSEPVKPLDYEPLRPWLKRWRMPPPPVLRLVRRAALFLGAACLTLGLLDWAYYRPDEFMSAFGAGLIACAIPPIHEERM